MMPSRWARGANSDSKPNSALSDGQSEGAGPSRPKNTLQISSKSVAERTSTRRPSPDLSAVGFHVCPICSKEFHVDNAGLNAHVDYCLSKDTIRLTASSSLPSRSDGKETASTPDLSSRPNMSGSKRKQRVDDSDEDGRGRPKAKPKKKGSDAKRKDGR